MPPTAVACARYSRTGWSIPYPCPLFHGVEELCKADRHVECEVAGMLPDVANGCRKACLRRLAFIDIEAAAVREHQIEIVAAAKDMVPGQPVQDFRRAGGQNGHHGRHLCL